MYENIVMYNTTKEPIDQQVSKNTYLAVDGFLDGIGDISLS